MSLQKILLRFEPKPESLLGVLKEIQKENKYVGKKECEKVAEYFSMPLASVYSFVSFFDELRTRKNGKRVVKICSGGPCMGKKATEVLRQLEMLLKTEAENDAHPKYRLEFVSCRGLCEQGPVLMIDEHVFERVKPETMDDILRNYL